jgi:hypothetical protein
MSGFHRFPRRWRAVAAALAVAFAPLAAAAQDDVPSYARPAVVSTDETIHGQIRSVDGAFTISVADDRGFIDNVELHQGTIINPTGLTLSPGMSVTIVGYNAGDTFAANEIDTPYTYDGPLPAPAYYGPGYWCPGFAYGYGPSFSLGIIIGGGSSWSYEHRPFRGRPWDGRRYLGAAVARDPAPSVRLEQRPRAAAERFGAGAPANGPASSRRYEETRGAAGRFEPTERTTRAPGYERGGRPTRSPGVARAGGAARASESARGGGGGGGHAH